MHADPERGEREVGRYAPLRVLHSPVLAHIEVLDLARYSSRHIPLFCVEARDVIDAALALNQVVEEGVGVVPERGEGSEASDDDLRAPVGLRVRPPVAARGLVRGTALHSGPGTFRSFDRSTCIERSPTRLTLAHDR